MITLYGVYRSRASRPLWLLAELALPFHHVPVIQSDRLRDPLAPDAPLNTASPAYLTISPLAQVPVINDAGLVLSESLAITLHIARRYGGLLGPQSVAEIALMDQWAPFATTSIEDPARTILSTVESGAAKTETERADRPQQRDPAPTARASGKPAWRASLSAGRPLHRGRHQFGGMPALCPTASPPDCRIPAVQDWINRCQQRPAFKAMWLRHESEAH